MSNLSNYLENKLVDLLLRAQAYSPAANVHVALLTCTHGVRINSTAYALNNTIVLQANDGKLHLYKCTTAGTTAVAQGSLYPGAADEVITDGTAQFTEQNAALDAGTATVEPSGNAYARVSVACSLAAWSGTQGAGTTSASSGTSGQSSNNAAITWTPPSGTWGFVWGFALYDASSSGNLLVWGPMTSGQTYGIGDSVVMSAGGLRVTVSGAFKNYLRNALIDFLLRGQTLTLPSSLYIALMLDTPSHSVAGSEVVAAGYARVPVARSLAAWSGTQGAGTTVASTGTNGESSNNSAIAFPTAGADWGTVKSVEMFDADTAGNSLFFGALTAQKTIVSGNTVPFSTGSLKVRMS